MNPNAVNLESIFEQQLFQFAGGLISGGFVFFTLLALTIVWFLNNPLLKLLLIFTTLQTILVTYDFQYVSSGSFGKFSLVKLILATSFTILVQQYLKEIKYRAQLKLKYLERDVYWILIISSLMLLTWFFCHWFLIRFTFTILLLYWFYLGVNINFVFKNASPFYRLSGFLLWFYSWVVFFVLLIPIHQGFGLHESQWSQITYLGWLGVSFFAAMSLIHQVVQLNAQNLKLESEQLDLKNKLGFAQLESSENERRRIVSELHNDVLNRIDMLSMTANQSALNQDNINLNLIDSLQVLRKYTYKLYPPHTDVLSIADIFQREAEIWSDSAVYVEVFFESSWNQLNLDYVMPIFRFVEFVTQSLAQFKILQKVVWNFSAKQHQLMLQIQAFGNFDNVYLNKDEYLIYKDLLNAELVEKNLDGSYEMSLFFNN
ncbi:MAG: hypothetical protein NBV77_05380 [Bacteroidia bacterium]|nr:hypothetical protein [Bacteroidia bacterium]